MFPPESLIFRRLLCPLRPGGTRLRYREGDGVEGRIHMKARNIVVVGVALGWVAAGAAWAQDDDWSAGFDGPDTGPTPTPTPTPTLTPSSGDLAVATGARTPVSATWGGGTVAHGRDLFRALCSGCHGAEGDGRAAAARSMSPRPRDFTSAEYRFRTTENGRLPTRQDLLRTVRVGLPGTPMPGWGGLLDERALRSTVLYLETLSPRFGEEEPGALAVSVASPPPATPALLARGEQIYGEMRCAKCHGEGGRGDGPAAAGIAKDGESAVFDFTTGVYKGGQSEGDVYRTFMTGLNGTPMPSYADSLPDETDRWALVHYCRSLTREAGTLSYLAEHPAWTSPAER
jgi:mono/diheme cytochrome c family protein